MIKRKLIRDRGKIRLSEYFREFKGGDRVSIRRELSLMPKFPKRLQGRSGVVKGKRGSNYVVRLKDLNKEKTYIIHPIHLRKLK